MGESFEGNIARAQDGARNSYGDLMERMERDPTYFSQMMSHRAKIALLKSPRFINRITQDLSKPAIMDITTDEIYQEIQSSGLYETWTPEFLEEWERKAQQREEEDEQLKKFAVGMGMRMRKRRKYG